MADQQTGTPAQAAPPSEVPLNDQGQPLVVGGPDGAPVDSGLVDVEIDGKSFKMTADAAEAFKSSSAATQKTVSDLKADVGRLRKQVNEPARQPDPQPASKQQSAPADELADLMYTDPAEYTRRVEERILGKVTTAYSQRQQMDGFWQTFYEQNPQLKKAEVIVKSVMDRDWGEIKDLPLNESSRVLADRASEEIVNITGGKAPSKAAKSEPAAPTSGKATETPDDEPVAGSLSEILKQRRARRRKAEGRGPASRTATA